MAQNNQDRDRQNQGDGYKNTDRDTRDESLREGRSGSSSGDSQRNQDNAGASRQDMGSDLDDGVDEMDDEDRDDDARGEGNQNRRRNIS